MQDNRFLLEDYLNDIGLDNGYYQEYRVEVYGIYGITKKEFERKVLT